MITISPCVEHVYYKMTIMTQNKRNIEFSYAHKINNYPARLGIFFF